MAATIGRKGESRARVLEVALALFAEHGVSGTSLQMIADGMGVTKAAVYHQFASKSEIVAGVISPIKLRMQDLAESAESEPTEARRFEAILGGLVDLALDSRAAASALRKDPVVARAIEEDEAYRAVIARIDRMLIGGSPDAAGRVALVLAGGMLLMPGIDPTLESIDPVAVRRTLVDSIRVVLEPHRA